MQIKEITNKDVWKNFLLECQEKTFLDSWNWGDFQRKTEDKIWRLGLYDNEKLIAVALVVKVKAKRGIFLFVPHGPVVKPKINIERVSILQYLIQKLKKIAEKEKTSFIRMAPIWENNQENINSFETAGFKMNAPIHMHPELTWELDINCSEEDLLKGMRKTTRYLIRQAEKNSDIEIIKTQNINDLEKFKDLLDKTALRHHFTAFSLDYLKNQFSCFKPDNQIMIYLGKYKGEIISGAVMIYWKNIGFYHHGASLSKYNSNKVPVSYLMQWEAIKEAKNRNCTKYNFWGIAPEDKKNHPWKGLTLFKKGFGGYKKEYVKTKDMPLSKLYAKIRYRATRGFEKLRKLKRRL